MTQFFNLAIGGTDVTSHRKELSVSEEMNRFYDVSTVTIDYEPLLDEEVVIQFGSRSFQGTVYRTTKIGKILYRVEVRTAGAKLTEPYSPYTESFDNAETSHALCDLYSTLSGVTINNTSENISFGGSYERKGTMLSALSNIASVTASEFWDDGSSIQIQPNKAITEDGIEIAPDEIFDFMQTSKSLYNRGVGFIVIRNGGSESDDIISKNSIYAEVDECSGEVFIYTNPFGPVEYIQGISPLSQISKEREETVSVLDVDVVELDGAIDTIASVTINGTAVTDYNFEQGHNVVYFNTLKRGSVKVTYAAYCYKGYANVENTSIGKFITFDIYYLDQVLLFQGFLSGDCSGSATDGDMACIMPSELYYNRGFDFWTIGGDLDISFYNGSDEIVRDVITVDPSVYTSVEGSTLEKQEDESYIYRPRYTMTAALGARSNGDDIPYVQDSDAEGEFFRFTQYYPKVEVSYEVTAAKHTVQFAEIANAQIVMVLTNINTEETCEYDLDTIIPCVLGQLYPVDVSSEIGVEVSQVRGLSLPYTNPNSSTGNVTVDDFGIANILVFIDGDYVIDTSSVKPRTSITLTSNVNG